jgi:5-methylcytosine-specific restriction endonuclease McrA
MPRKLPNGERDYSYDTKYESSKQQRANRVERDLARRELTKEGKVSKGDRKDVDHIKPVSKGGTNSRSNLRAISASANRSKGNRKA